jgi:hypothetical protein
MSGHGSDGASSSIDARQRRLRHVLEGYGVLTRRNLRELCHADGWEVPFDVVLTRAVRCGRIKQLSDDLFELGEVE